MERRTLSPSVLVSPLIFLSRERVPVFSSIFQLCYLLFHSGHPPLFFSAILPTSTSLPCLSKRSDTSSDFHKCKPPFFGGSFLRPRWVGMATRSLLFSGRSQILGPVIGFSPPFFSALLSWTSHMSLGPLVLKALPFVFGAPRDFLANILFFFSV